LADAAGEYPIENRKEDAVVAIHIAVMQHVMPPRKSHKSGKPSSHVDTPMDFLVDDKIDCEAGKHSNAERTRTENS
jgi:hypothetical protein